MLRAILKVEIVEGRPVMGTAQMYRDLGVLTVQNIFKIRLFKLLNQLLSGELPSFYNMLLNPLVPNHSHNTRHGNFRHPVASSGVLRRAIDRQMVLLYEEIPANVFVDDSVRASTRNYKKLLLASQ